MEYTTIKLKLKHRNRRRLWNTRDFNTLFEQFKLTTKLYIHDEVQDQIDDA